MKKNFNLKPLIKFLFNVFQAYSESSSQGKVDDTKFSIKSLDSNDNTYYLPQRLRVRASVGDLDFDLYFNQVQGIINDPSSKSKVYIKNGKDVVQAILRNLVNIFLLN